jgi:hypothetical protein
MSDCRPAFPVSDGVMLRDDMVMTGLRRHDLEPIL